MKEYKGYFEQLSKDRAQFEERVHSLEQENEDLKAEVKRLSSSLAISKEENLRMRTEVSDWLRKAENIENDKKTDRDYIAELEQVNFEHKTKISSLGSEIDILKHYVENQGFRNSEVFS